VSNKHPDRPRHVKTSVAIGRIYLASAAGRPKMTCYSLLSNEVRTTRNFHSPSIVICSHLCSDITLTSLLDKRQQQQQQVDSVVGDLLANCDRSIVTVYCRATEITSQQHLMLLALPCHLSIFMSLAAARLSPFCRPINIHLKI